MLLGEARSKCEHIAGVPLRPEVAKELYQVSLAKGVHATTAIEGNTLSESDVKKHLEGTLHVPPSKQYLVQELTNILEALNMYVHRDMVSDSLSPLCPKRIREFNAVVLQKLKLEEGIVPGEVRTYEVGVGRYRGAPAEDCDHLLHRMCGWLNGPEFEAPDDRQEFTIPLALLKAALAHLYLAWIHPFGGGNGRTARIVEVQLLAMAGVPDVACHLLSNHYNETRAEYYRQLAQASASGGDVLPFIEYAIAGFVEGLTGHLDLIRAQQWHVSWVNHVHGQFTKKTRSANRVKELVLELSRKFGPELEQSAPVPRRELPNMSPQLAVTYAGKDKTLSRDLNALERMGLVRRSGDGYEPCREVILAFLPARKRSHDSAGSPAPSVPPLRRA
jgi:Fic family protein